MNRLFKYVFLSLVVTALCAASAWASEPVYVVDVQKVINESIVGKAARSNMELEIKKREGPLKKLQNDVEALRKDFEKQASLLSQDALKAKKSQIDSKERELQEEFQKSRGELSKMNNDEIAKVVKDIDAIVKALSAEKGYKMVLEKDSRFVVYADPEFDLTQTVVEKLNSKKLDS